MRGSLGQMGVALVVLGLTACTQGPVPEAPCALDCGASGACAIVLGTEACVCDEGYEGERCDACTGGFVNMGGQCAPDPCEPNPCTGPHQGACSVVPEGFECSCDEIAQDNDGDGACRPACAFFEARHPGQSCDDSSGDAIFTGPRSCQVLVDIAPEGQNYDTLVLAGEFNGWDQGAAMTKTPEGTFQATLDLPPGDYGYKFYNPTSDEWFEDTSNPYTKYVDGFRNSRLRVPDCSLPMARLLHTPDAEGGQIAFKVQIVGGTGGASVGPDGVSVTRNGLPVSPNLDAATGVVTIDDKDLPAGKYGYRFEVTDSAGKRATPLFVPVWVEDARFEWEDAIMYFVFTDRFADGDPSNNAPVPGVETPANWQGGDFAGLRQKIESGYFETLGVNALWISSISMNTGRSGTGIDGRQYSAYHSYWPISTGWREGNEMLGVEPVDPHFGTLDDFKALVKLAHDRGIRVLVDFVANHVHEDSPLWQQHQFDDPAWFHVPPLGCQESNWTQPIECWFANYLPDFEYRNLDVMKGVAEHALWMMRETNIDGFRLDAVKHMINDFTYTLRGRIDEDLFLTGERFYMVGETFTGEDGAEALKQYIGPDQLDGQFDFPLYWQVTSVFMREERDLRSLEGMLKWSEGFYGDFAVMSNFLGNHDVCRAVSQANGEFGDMWCNGGKEQGWTNPPGVPGAPEPFDRLNLAWTFLMTAPGIPLIYYGDEYGMPGAGDPDNRRFMQFDAALSPLQKETLAHVGRLSAVRHAHPALRHGERRTLNMSDDGLLWTFAMEGRGDLVGVTLNRSGSSRVESIDANALGLPDGSVVVEELTGTELVVEGGLIKIELEPRSSAVWVQK